MSKAAMQDAGDGDSNGRHDTETHGTAAADLVGLYAACGQPASVVAAVADPGRALATAAVLTRPSTSLAAALTLANLVTGGSGSSAAGPVVVAFMSLVAGCSTVARDRSKRRRAFVLGLANPGRADHSAHGRAVDRR